MKELRIMFFLLTVVITTSCFAPYRMEVYRPPDGIQKIGDPPYTNQELQRFLVGGDYLEIGVQASGHYTDEAYPPYRVSLWLISGDLQVDSVRIHDVSITLNGEPVDDIALENLDTHEAIPVPGQVKDLSPAPCCRFRAITDWIDIGHVPGNLLIISVELEVSGPQGTSREVIERTFVAKTKRGLFQFDF